MIYLAQLLVVSALVLLCYQLYQYGRIRYRYHTILKQHGCGELPRAPNKFPGGLDHLWRIFTYRGDDILGEVLVPPFERLGKTYYQQILGRRTIHTADPRNFQAILGTAWEDFPTGIARHAPFAPLIRKSMLTTDGAEWRHSRGLTKPSFARDQLNDLTATEGHVQNLLRTLPTDASGWTEDVDLLDRFLHLTIDASTEFFFGKSVDSQLISATANAELDGTGIQANPESRRADKEFVEMFGLTAEYTMHRTLLQELYFLKDGFRFRKAVRMAHGYVDDIVAAALRKARDGKRKDDRKGKYVFLDELVASTQDPEELRDSVLTLLIAGRDTTASLLGWIFFFLARHPAAFDRLRAEVISRFGTGDVTTELDYPALKSVPYLQWVINESLRLHAVVSLTNRQCARDTVLPAGGGTDGSKPVPVLKGEKIFLYFYAAHRDEETWGPDATEFKPERWEHKRIGWDFIPFGGGPRVCVGQHFGLVETSYVVLRLCQHFDAVKHTDARHNYSKVVKLTVSAANGVRVQLHRPEKVR